MNTSEGGSENAGYGNTEGVNGREGSLKVQAEASLVGSSKLQHL